MTEHRAWGDGVVDVVLGSALFLSAVAYCTDMPETFLAPKVLVVQVAALLADGCRLATSGGCFEVPSHPVFLCMYAGFVWQALTCLWSVDGPSSLRALGMSASVLALAVVAHGIRDERRQYRILAVAVVGAALSAVVGLLQYYGLDGAVFGAIRIEGLFEPGRLVAPLRPGSRPFLHGLAGNRNYLACLLMTMTPLLVGSSTGRVVPLLGAMLFSVVLLLSYARGAWLGLAAAMAFLGLSRGISFGGPVAAGVWCVGWFAVAFGSPTAPAWFAAAAVVLGAGGALVMVAPVPDRKRRVAVVVVLTLVAATLAAGRPDNPLSRARYSLLRRLEKLFEVDRSGPLARRLVWSAAWRMVTSSPRTTLVGQGVGTFGSRMAEVQAQIIAEPGGDVFLPKVGWTRYVHDEPLHVWCETGLVGLSLAVGAVVAFVGLWRRRTVDETFGAAIVAVVVHDLVGFGLRVPTTAVLFVVLVAFAVTRADGRVVRWAPSTVGRGGVVVAYAAIVLLAAPSAVRRARAQIDWGRALRHDIEGRRVEAVVAMRRALDHDPTHPDMVVALARLLQPNHPNDALTLLDDLARRRSTAEIHVLRAWCLAATGQPDRAAEAAARALSLQPADPMAVQTAVELGLRRRDAAAVESVLDRCERARHLNRAELQARARALAVRGDFEGAWRVINAAVDEDRVGDVTAAMVFDLLVISLEAGEWRDALRAYKRLSVVRGDEAVRAMVPRRQRVALAAALLDHEPSKERLDELVVALSAPEPVTLPEPMLVRVRDLLDEAIVADPENERLRRARGRLDGD